MLSRAAVCLATVGGIWGCTDREDGRAIEAEPGAPLPGLTASELERFERGRALFDRAFFPEDGLGPLYNQTRCSSCHDLPEVGGHGAEPVVKATAFDASAGCDLLVADGGDLIQTSVLEPLRLAGVGPERVPARATAVTEIRPPPLFGLGLVELVDPSAMADPEDRDGDGISGRAPPAADGGPGRFGAKGTHATLRAFIASAALGEMGLTSPEHPAESTLNGAPLPPGADVSPDPELDDEALDLLTAYVRFLAPPVRREPEDPGERAEIAEGERLFERAGCADCHVPTLRSESSPVSALHERTFRVYSDLLLHDLGPESADVCGPDATPSEWLTARLVGLRHRHVFMHSGRAQGLEAAIMLHGGEGDASRRRYQAMTAEEKAALMRFLRSL